MSTATIEFLRTINSMYRNELVGNANLPDIVTQIGGPIVATNYGEFVNRVPSQAGAAESWLPDAFQRWRDDAVSRIMASIEGDKAKLSQLIPRWRAEGKMVENYIDAFIGEHTRKKAVFLQRNAIENLNAMLTMNRNKAVGIDAYVWQTVQDQRVRNNHKTMQDKICSWDDPNIIWDSTAKTWVERDVDMVHMHPGLDYNCRCTSIAYLIPDDNPAAATADERRINSMLNEEAFKERTDEFLATPFPIGDQAPVQSRRDFPTAAQNMLRHWPQMVENKQQLQASKTFIQTIEQKSISSPIFLFGILAGVLGTNIRFSNKGSSYNDLNKWVYVDLEAEDPYDDFMHEIMHAKTYNDNTIVRQYSFPYIFVALEEELAAWEASRWLFIGSSTINSYHITLLLDMLEALFGKPTVRMGKLLGGIIDAINGMLQYKYGAALAGDFINQVVVQAHSRWGYRMPTHSPSYYLSWVDPTSKRQQTSTPQQIIWMVIEEFFANMGRSYFMQNADFTKLKAIFPRSLNYVERYIHGQDIN